MLPPEMASKVGLPVSGLAAESGFGTMDIEEELLVDDDLADEG